MNYTAEITHMCPVAKGAYHGPAPIPEEGKWVQAKEIGELTEGKPQRTAWQIMREIDSLED